MEKLSNRLKNFYKFTKRHIITKLFSGKINKKCIESNTLDKSIKLNDTILSNSLSADILFGIDKNINIAIKQLPLNSLELELLTKENVEISALSESNSDVLNELFYMVLTTNLLTKKICPGLPFLLSWYICDTCEFRNKKIKNKTGKCLFLVTEKADGTLSNLLETGTVSLKILFSLYLQIFLALYTIKEKYQIEHLDLHNENVLYFKVKPGGVWNYVINGKNYKVPNYGYLVILWDFAFSISLNKKFLNTKDNLTNYLYRNYDMFNDHYRSIQGISSISQNCQEFSKTIKGYIAISTKNIDPITLMINKLNRIDNSINKRKIIETYDVTGNIFI